MYCGCLSWCCNCYGVCGFFGCRCWGCHRNCCSCYLSCCEFWEKNQRTNGYKNSLQYHEKMVFRHFMSKSCVSVLSIWVFSLEINSLGPSSIKIVFLLVSAYLLHSPIHAVLKLQNSVCLSYRSPVLILQL